MTGRIPTLFPKFPPLSISALYNLQSLKVGGPVTLRYFTSYCTLHGKGKGILQV